MNSTIRNQPDRQAVAGNNIGLPPIARVAELLGGDVRNGEVLAPGPQHSAADRSMAVQLNPNAPDGFVVHSFSGDDDVACKDYVRSKLGLPAFQPKTGNGKTGGGWQFVRQHVYRKADGTPHLRKTKKIDPAGKKQFPQEHWDGHDWVNGVPEGWPKHPYRLPELSKAPATNVIYVTEGERDADSLAKLGFTATTIGGVSSTWTPELVEHFRDRRVVILVDADPQGRQYGEKTARALDPVTTSLKLIDLFPDRTDGRDVTDFLERDTSAIKLMQIVRDAPEWEPGADPKDDPGAEKTDDELIAELAALPELHYERRREAAAERLGIRASVLDKLVKAARDAEKERAKEASPALYEHWVVEPADEPVDGGELLEEIVDTVRRYVVVTEVQAVVVALWIVFAWLHDIASHSPMLLVTSPAPNSGKSTLLKIINFLVRKGLSSVLISGAALFRSIEKWSPSFALDEADKAFVNNPDLEAVVNSGWTRGDVVIRCDPDTHEPRGYSTFCPKSIGMNGKNLPPATLSRCLNIAMQRKKRGERIEDWDYCDNETFARLRSRLLRFATENAEALAKATPEIPPSFDNRVRANWRLLLAIAERAGGRWKREAQKAAQEIEQLAAAADPGIRVRLLSDIRDVFARLNTDRVTTKTLIAELISDLEGPWLSYGKSGKPITDRQLAALLSDFNRGYGIKSKTLRIGDATAKGYEKAQLEDDWASYLPPLSPKTPSASVTPKQTSVFSGLDEISADTSGVLVTDENAANPLENNNCYGVTDKKPVLADARDNDGQNRLCCQCYGPFEGNERFYEIDGNKLWLHPQCADYLTSGRG
jgi:5S rRNA maturation endonuclease (ribonuclease M5)